MQSRSCSYILLYFWSLDKNIRIFAKVLRAINLDSFSRTLHYLSNVQSISTNKFKQ